MASTNVNMHEMEEIANLVPEAMEEVVYALQEGLSPRLADILEGTQHLTEHDYQTALRYTAGVHEMDLTVKGNEDSSAHLHNLAHKIALDLTRLQHCLEQRDKRELALMAKEEASHSSQEGETLAEQTAKDDGIKKEFEHLQKLMKAHKTANGHASLVMKANKMVDGHMNLMKKQASEIAAKTVQQRKRDFLARLTDFQMNNS